MSQKPILVFQTDFTYKEGAVCAMYGVVKSVDRTLEIFDGTHELPQFDIYSASYRLWQSMRFWPKGTVFVSVVDPGVGTKRRACVARTADGYFVVTPDNGTLTHVAHEVGITEVREIDERVNRLYGKGVDDVNVFHGRDLFGYCAARFASGIISFEGVGEPYPVEEIVKMDIQQPKVSSGVISGVLEINDPNFGNTWSNIGKSLFDEAGIQFGHRLNVRITHKETVVFDAVVPYFSSFGFVGIGECVAYVNELNKIALALCQDSFCQRFGVSFGVDWKIEFTVPAQ